MDVDEPSRAGPLPLRRESWPDIVERAFNCGGLTLFPAHLHLSVQRMPVALGLIVRRDRSELKKFSSISRTSADCGGPSPTQLMVREVPAIQALRAFARARSSSPKPGRNGTRPKQIPDRGRSCRRLHFDDRIIAYRVFEKPISDISRRFAGGAPSKAKYAYGRN